MNAKVVINKDCVWINMTVNISPRASKAKAMSNRICVEKTSNLYRSK